MNGRDGFYLFLWTALVFALSAPALLNSRMSFANFGDLYAYHFPLRHLAASMLESGRLPFWNSYIFGGLPLWANSQAALLYPLSVLGRIFGTLPALSWDLAFHLWWAGLGAALLGRSQGLGSSEAWTLACVYALSPFLIYRIAEGIPTQLSALAWVPWCWLAWSSNFSGALGGVWALQFLSGHPQFLIINACAMLVWSAGLSFSRGIFIFAREAAVALILTAAQWIPTAEFVGQSLRAGWPLSFSLAYSVGLKEMLTWLWPGAWGDPVTKSYVGAPSVFFETGAAYLGPALAVSVLGFWKGRWRWKMLGLVLLGLFFAAGSHNPGYVFFLKKTPLSFLRTPARWLFCCVLGILFGVGASFKKLRPVSGVLRFFLAALIIGDLLFWDHRFLRFESAEPYVAANHDVALKIAGAPFRIMTEPDIPNADKAMLYRARNVNGYDAFYPASFALYASRSEKGPAADASRGYLSRLGTPETRRWGVLYKLGAGGFINDPGALPPCYAVTKEGLPLKGSLRCENPSPEHWKASGLWPSKAAGLVFSEADYPGWRVRWNGAVAKALRWDGWFLAMPDPSPQKAGEPFMAEASFVPSFWPLLVLATVLSWGVWLLRLI
jgi:hypothetical protein